MIRGAAIPVQVRAYLSGKVVEVLPKEGCVIEDDVMFVQGIFGIGGETEGVIQVACGGHGETLDADAITADMKGAVILGGARMTAAALREGDRGRRRRGGLRRTRRPGSQGTPRPRPRGRDHRQRDHRDHGDRHRGIRRHRDGGAHLATARGRGPDGSPSVNGATQIRAGVMRPEILVPLEAGENENEIDPTLAREAGCSNSAPRFA